VTVKDTVLKALIPAAAWAMTLAVPIVPQFVWSALLTALLNGNITLDHLLQFMKDHNIQIYQPKDIQTPNAEPTNTNMVSGGYADHGPSSM
jgi:hypothetical protein